MKVVSIISTKGGVGKRSPLVLPATGELLHVR